MPVTFVTSLTRPFLDFLLPCQCVFCAGSGQLHPVPEVLDFFVQSLIDGFGGVGIEQRAFIGDQSDVRGARINAANAQIARSLVQVDALRASRIQNTGLAIAGIDVHSHTGAANAALTGLKINRAAPDDTFSHTENVVLCADVNVAVFGSGIGDVQVATDTTDIEVACDRHCLDIVLDGNPQSAGHADAIIRTQGELPCFDKYIVVQRIEASTVNTGSAGFVQHRAGEQ